MAESLREGLLGESPTFLIRDLRASPARAHAAPRLPCCAALAARLCSPAAFLSFCFCCCGLGVALPWTALRMGVAYFSMEYSSAVYPRLYCLYYATQAAILLLQCSFDRAVDLAVGASATFTVRLTCSISALVLLLAAFPLAATSETTLYLLTACVGVFDACAFGSCAQLFSSIKTTSASGFYFLGSSLSSLLAIALSEATGFTALSAASQQARALAVGALPAPLWTFYAVCAAFTLGALLAVVALLSSQQGAGYLQSIDDALLESAPLSPRALKRTASGGSLARNSPEGSVSSTGSAKAGAFEMIALAPAAAAAAAAQARPYGSLQQAAAAAAEEEEEEEEEAAGAQGGEDWEQRQLLARMNAPASKPSDLSIRIPHPEDPGAATAAAALTSSLDLFRATFHSQLVIFFIWGSTTAVDSLISYYPSQTQSSAGDVDGLFTVSMLYASLGGELCGKLGFLTCGGRRVYDDGEEGERVAAAVRGEEGAAQQQLRRRRSDFADAPYTTVPCITSTRLLLWLALLRAAAVAPFYLLVLQQLIGPQRGPLLRGWFYSDTLALCAQFLFDMAGSFLSSLTYTLIPFMIAQSDRSQASSILSFTLTLGTFLGLGGSLLLSSYLPLDS